MSDDRCPRCGEPLEYDEVDIGIGTVRGGPGCPACHRTPGMPDQGREPNAPAPGHAFCGRCYDEVPEAELREANCAEKPEALLGQPMGMYHCPNCGGMVIAGIAHPRLCTRCFDRTHPAFDRAGGWEP